MTKKLLFDTEYNNIDSFRATKIWCVTAVDMQTKAQFKFHPKAEGPDQYHDQFGDEFVEFLKKYDHYIGHNFWGAEAVVCKNLLGFEFKPEQVTDTLVLSRTQRPVTPYSEHYPELKKKGLDTRLGGHSLKAWGQRLGFNKIEFDDFTQFTFDQLDYCMRDSDVNVKMYEYLIWEQKELGFDPRVVEVEHEIHRRLVEQYINGFTLNKDRATKLLNDTGTLIQEYVDELHKVFPPIKIETRRITPRKVWKEKRDSKGNLVKNSFGENIIEEKIHGTDHNTLLKNMHEEVLDDDGKPTGEYALFRMEVFNPNSPAQVGKRLMSLGWNPRKFTATNQPSTSKEVLGEAIDQLSQKVPEVEVLRKYNIITHRHGLARDWLENAELDGKVHGSMAHIGPWTHRSSHYKPNMGNVPKVSVDKEGKPKEGIAGNFGWDSRNCLVVPDGKILVGADASGIQLRALAHYMGDPSYIKEVCEGDIHVANMEAAGITRGYHGMSPRDVAKRFIYAWLLGAGDEKVGIIVGVEEDEYEELFTRAREEFKWNRWRHKRGDRRRNKYDNLLYWVTDKLRSDGRIADRPTAAGIMKGYFTKKQFLESLPALKELKEVVIPEAAKQGFMIGLDGRKIWVPSEHLAMGAYLQGFEATIMKWAMILYQDKLIEQNIPFKQVGYVHDEYQIETYPEYGDVVGETVVWAIQEAGRILESKCPLDGEYKIGTSWAETH